MDFDASFEAKLQEHLRAVALAADESKEFVRLGIAGLLPEAAPEPSAPAWVPPPKPAAAVSFDDLLSPEVEGGAVDDEGIPVWEDPP